MGAINLYVLAAHPAFINGIKKNDIHGRSIILSGFCTNIDVSLQYLKRKPADVLFIDDFSFEQNKLFNFLDVLPKSFPATQKIIYTNIVDDGYLSSLRYYGVRGIIYKRESPFLHNDGVLDEKIREIIYLVNKGYVCYDNTISYSIQRPVWAKDDFREDNYKDAFNNITLLSAREKEILLAVAEGKKNKEIADSLFISYHTVEAHKVHILLKLNLKNTTELTIFAVSNKNKIKLQKESY